MEPNGFTWFMIAWLCCWPVLAVVFAVLWLTTKYPSRWRLVRRIHEEDDDER
jgi:hypothetical protein